MQGTAAAGAGGRYPLQHLSRGRETSPDPPDSDTVTSRGVNKHSRSFHNITMTGEVPNSPTRAQLITGFKCTLSLSEYFNKFLTLLLRGGGTLCPPLRFFAFYPNRRGLGVAEIADFSCM